MAEETGSGAEQQGTVPIPLRVADEAWVATALLHREQPDREDFTVQEIVRRAERAARRPLRPGVRMHVSYHAVANKKPNPGSHCLLFATARGRRRLFRPGDPCHPDRRGRRVPQADRLPPIHRPLVAWYHAEYVGADSERRAEDPILALRGLGRAIWADEEADAYVRRLREGWS